jgi:uncharacterized protein (TIGR02588 family)
MARPAKSSGRKPAASQASSRKPPTRARPPANDIPLFEWIAAGIGLVLALVALTFTAWDAFLGERSPASIEVRLVGVRQTPYGFVADVEAFNHGGAPATQVIISGTVTGSGEPDTAEATFDYIPEQSRARGGLVFEEDPRAGGLKLRAKSYVDVS